jgi:ubiquinone biosynthesis protein Coq4
MNLRKLFAMIREYRAGTPLGDVAVLKIDAFAAPDPAIARELATVRGYTPPHDVAALRALPAGTLGREYARFLDANGIEPLAISDAMRERFRDDPYPLRYTTTHDLHHVLAGFDAGLAGEAGVFAFNVGQGSAPGRTGALLRVACVVWSIMSPGQARRIWHNVRVGRESGRRAQLLIAQPLESWFGEPLAQVRARLGIPDPQAAGVLPSRASAVADAIYGRKRAA